MHEAVLLGVQTFVVGVGRIGGSGQCCGDESGDGGILLWGSVAWVARVLRAVAGVVRGEEVL